MLDEKVPSNAPGIISLILIGPLYKDNYARRSEHDIREVLDKSQVLKKR